MHNRYTDQEMAAIWSEQEKYETWFDVEHKVCEIYADLGKIPYATPKTMDSLREACFAGDFVDKIEEIERVTKHDIIAFLTHLSNVIGEPAKHIHYGMTSQDLIDTAQAILVKRSILLILNRLSDLKAAIKEKAVLYKQTICMGRSHGIHAEPMTFGLKLLTHYAGFDRCAKALWRDLPEMVRIKCSGAIGTYSMIDPQVETTLSSKLGIPAEDIATQVVPRDRLALLFSHLSITASCIERLAVEIRHLQRTEVGEVIESFTPGQKGSSAMPHKKNPILTENLTGLARAVRMSLTPAMENVALWHERDISHSSLERIALPDTFTHLSFALDRLTDVVNRMYVNTDRMRDNVWSQGGTFFSQRILLALIDKGMTREDAYKIVQEAAHANTDNFRYAIMSKDLFSKEELNEYFGLTQYTKNVDYIFNKVLQE
jgi:adenylosuccinate lyase